MLAMTERAGSNVADQGTIPFALHSGETVSMSIKELTAFKMSVIGRYPCFYKNPESSSIINASQIYAVGIDFMTKSHFGGLNALTQTDVYDYYYNIFVTQIELLGSSNLEILGITLGDGDFLRGIPSQLHPRYKLLIKQAQLKAFLDKMGSSKLENVSISILDFADSIKDITNKIQSYEQAEQEYFQALKSDQLKQHESGFEDRKLSKILNDTVTLLEQAQTFCKLLTGRVDANIKANESFFTQAQTNDREIIFMQAGDVDREAMLAAQIGGKVQGDDSTIEEWSYLTAGAATLPFTVLFELLLNNNAQ